MLGIVSKLTGYVAPALGVAALISIMFNVFLNAKLNAKEQDLEEKAGVIATIEGQRDHALSNAVNLESQIEKMEREKKESQARTDELERLLANSENKEAKTITEIREVIKYEDCTNKLIPDSNAWLYNKD